MAVVRVHTRHRGSRVVWQALLAVALMLTACGKKPEPAKPELADKAKMQAQGPEGAVQSASKQVAPEPQPAKASAKVAEPKVAADSAKQPAKEKRAEPQGKDPGASGERPLYYDRRITPEDLKGRTLREFSLLRNTIFARVGNSFRKTWLDEHFRAQPWYKPLDKAQLDRLSAIDKKNVEIIVQAQEALRKVDLEKAREELLAVKKRSKQQDRELRLLSAHLGKWAGNGKDKAPDRTPLEDPTLLDKTLKLSSLKEMSRRDLRILRNTIYARRGRDFSSPLVGSYFYRMSWYKPSEHFKPSMLTATDRRNIKIIKSLEHSLGGPIRDNDHPEDDWMYVA